MNYIKKTGNFISWLFIALLFAAAAAILIPRAAGREIRAVVSGSMAPTYKVGDMIYAVPAEFEEIRQGDVITYVLNEELTVVTHRIIEIDETNRQFYTRGDANNTADGTPVRYENVLGVVRFSIPHAGRLILMLENEFYKAAAIAGIICFMLLSVIWKKGRKDVSAEEIKRKWLAAVPVVLILCAAILAIQSFTLGTLKTVTGERINSFSLGSVPHEVDEGDIDPDEVEWGTENKPVSIENTGTADALVRALVLPLLTDHESGHYLSGSMGTLEAPEGHVLILGELTFHFREEFINGKSNSWVFNPVDGYFYYRKVLEPSSTTEQLLSGVTLTNEEDAETYQNTEVWIEVLSDSLQTGGDAPAQWGAEIEEQGHTVTYSFE